MFCILKSTHFVCQRVLKGSNLTLRNVSFVKKIFPKPVLLDKSKHKIIYEFPYIRITSNVIRTKIWVPAIITLTSSAFFLFEGSRVIILGGLLSSGLHYMLVHHISKILVNLIGKVYVKAEENGRTNVIISAIDVNGRRIDRSHDSNDLVICDFSTKVSQSFGIIKIFIQNTGIIYQMNVINGKIHSTEDYTSLFGSNYILQKNNGL